MEIINFEMIKHPMNWITILVMLIFGAFLVEIIGRWYSTNVASRIPVALRPSYGASGTSARM